jgi:hypothetical protein
LNCKKFLAIKKNDTHAFKLRQKMKAMINSILLSTLLFACKNEVKQESQKFNHEAFIKQYFDYFNAHDWKNFANLYTDTAEFLDPTLGKTAVPQTRQQTIEKYTALSQMIPDAHDQLVAMYTSGDNTIIVEFIASGTGPDSAKFQLPICGILTIKNGLITKDHSYFDNE